MYPHVNGVGGTNGAGNSRQSNGTTGRQESSSQEPSIFSRKMSKPMRLLVPIKFSLWD